MDHAIILVAGWVFFAAWAVVVVAVSVVAFGRDFSLSWRGENHNHERREGLLRKAFWLKHS